MNACDTTVSLDGMLVIYIIYAVDILKNTFYV